MELTIEKAEGFLEKASECSKNEIWINHSRLVASVAKEIADALQVGGVDIDIEKTYALGLIHDIGKMVGSHADHAWNGYTYLKGLGYSDEYAGICLTHSLVVPDARYTPAGLTMPAPDSEYAKFIETHVFALEEKVVTMADLLCGQKIVSLGERLADITIRHGTNNMTQKYFRACYEFKAQFDQLIGSNLYDLFPVIRENL